MPVPTPATPGERAARLTPEPWAVGALVAAVLLGWCPLAAFGAIVAGGVALRRIRAAPRPGARMAWAAIVIAALILLLEGWGFERLTAGVQESMEVQSIAAIEATLRGREDAAVQWATETGADRTGPAEVRAFSDAIGLGALRRATITGRSVEGAMDPRITVAFNADFERGKALGKAVFSTVRGTLPPELRLESFEVETSGVRRSLPATKPSER
jgi:hypothetical protein